MNPRTEFFRLQWIYFHVVYKCCLFPQGVCRVVQCAMSFVLDLSEALVAGYTPYHSILRAKTVYFCPKQIFNAIVCLLALKVFFFLSLQPLERRCSLTKGVSYFLLILSCPLQ